MNNEKCGSCRHWMKHPANPGNLTAPAQGDCRAAPPQLTLVNGPAGPQMLINYPITPAEFPACGLFTLRLAISQCDHAS